MTVYVLKVALKGNKRIWRTIAIRGDQSFDDLHAEIFNAFDREEEHLYSFYFPRPGYRGRDLSRNALEVAHGSMTEEDDRVKDAAKTTIESLRLRKGQKFAYLFDYGDCWWHEITVESADGQADGGDYPRVVKASGKSPPQYPDNEEEEDEEGYEDDE
ncbi:MAG: plasmid pRiA4b ORF-3 family protein [Planctomycetia bacterium]|nr:plasmid pRiA4b ORF-3 family protein [Planctomycetia bacterium]